jgi:L,D-transpeptidase catalytic domain
MPGYTPAGASAKRGAGLQTAIVVLVLIAVAVGAYFVFFKGEGKKPGGGGTVNGGKVGVTSPNGKTSPTNGGGTKANPMPSADVPGKDEFRKGDYKSAAAKLAAYVEAAGKDNPTAFYMLGRSYQALKQNAAAEKALAQAIKLDPSGAAGGAAALCLGDQLYAKYFAKIDEQDRTRWERIRDVYSVALRTAGFGTDRAQLVGRLNKLNASLLWTRMLTRDSELYKVMPDDSVEKIAVRKPMGLPRDCAKSISRINKLRSDRISVGDKLKVIRPLKMEIFVSKKHLKLTAFLNGYFFGEFPVGIGKGGATPVGEFKTTTKDKNPDWTQTLPSGEKKVWKFNTKENILGTRWMGMKDRPEIGAIGLGIHGTTQPKTVPGRESAGCIRMLNKDVELLYDFTPSGTRVVVTK